MNAIHGDKGLSVDMENVIKMEESNFKEVLNSSKKMEGFIRNGQNHQL